jgi:hypothetical protein
MRSIPKMDLLGMMAGEQGLGCSWPVVGGFSV